MLTIPLRRLPYSDIVCFMLSLTISCAVAGCTQTKRQQVNDVAWSYLDKSERCVDAGYTFSAKTKRKKVSHVGWSWLDTRERCLICCQKLCSSHLLLLCPNPSDAIKKKHAMCIGCNLKISEIHKKNSTDGTFYYPCPFCKEPIYYAELLEAVISSGDKGSLSCAFIEKILLAFFDEMSDALDREGRNKDHVDMVLKFTNMLIKYKYFTIYETIKSKFVYFFEKKIPSIAGNHSIYLHNQDGHGTTLLHVAISNNYEEITRVLIGSSGVYLKSRNKEGLTPLELAISLDRLKIVKWLIESQNVELNSVDRAGNTPIHLAVLNHRVEIVKWLIRKKVNLNRQNDTGRTPLASAKLNGYTEIIRLLEQARRAKSKLVLPWR